MRTNVGSTVSTVAALRICAEYAGPWVRRVRRICGLLQVTRNRERHLPHESVWESADEMLGCVQKTAATNFWNTAGTPIEQIPQKIGSPFGDW